MSHSDPRVIYDPRSDTIERVLPVFTGAPHYLPTHSGEPGAYEMRLGSNGRELVSGECAAGDGAVNEGDPFVVMYHDSIRPGGIFHKRCKPQGDRWYGLEPLDNPGEAPTYE
jgi:hypothetical protein